MSDTLTISERLQYVIGHLEATDTLDIAELKALVPEIARLEEEAATGHAALNAAWRASETGPGDE